MAKITKLQEHLRYIGACHEAKDWACQKTAKEAWEQCQRADWLLWWSARTSNNTKQQIVLAACACARTALKYVPDDELRPLQAIELAERWANGDASIDVNDIRSAAYAYAAADAADAAAYAAAYAAYAAYAADAAAYAAYAAAYAAYAADAHAATRIKAHKNLCIIVRSILKQPWSES